MVVCKTSATPWYVFSPLVSFGGFGTSGFCIRYTHLWSIRCLHTKHCAIYNMCLKYCTHHGCALAKASSQKYPVPFGSYFEHVKHCRVAICLTSTQHRLTSSASSNGRIPCVPTDCAVCGFRCLGQRPPFGKPSTWTGCLNAFGMPTVSLLRTLSTV